MIFTSNKMSLLHFYHTYKYKGECKKSYFLLTVDEKTLSSLSQKEEKCVELLTLLLNTDNTHIQKNIVSKVYIALYL